MVCPRSRSERLHRARPTGMPRWLCAIARSGRNREAVFAAPRLALRKFSRLGRICSVVNYWNSGIYDQNESGLSQVNEILSLLEKFRGDGLSPFAQRTPVRSKIAGTVIFTVKTNLAQWKSMKSYGCSNIFRGDGLSPVRAANAPFPVRAANASASNSLSEANTLDSFRLRRV